MSHLENYTYADIKVGASATLTKTLNQQDVQLFAILTGDINPTHVDKTFVEKYGLEEVIGHGMWCGALLSTLFGTKLPGPGSYIKEQNIRFIHPVQVGDTITLQVKVAAKEANRAVVFQCDCYNQKKQTILTGTAIVIAPEKKIHFESPPLPEIRLHNHTNHHEKILQLAKPLAAIKTAVVHPTTPDALLGAIEAQKKGLIEPLLIAPVTKLQQLAKSLQVDLTNLECIDVKHSHAAAETAVECVRTGKVHMLMKGSLHTDELLHSVLQRKHGLRTDKRLSHVFVLDIPTYAKPLLLTDCAINIDPDLSVKQDIVQHAINLARAIDIPEPKVAILSAVETVNVNLQSTLDAAALCKMADRKQIIGGILDGPLAFDNAISEKAALEKGIMSPVAGKADILLAPNLEAGNMLAKQLEYLAESETAGLALGAKVPIVLTSRADSVYARIVSCALGVLYAHKKVY